ncbi:7-keto-8-aminopelargonate synthetase-like enzyme [Pedobacter africanus]|uniref:7-keto-8-aminopelargonate synthetase-like enzyme n=1 Tax=Pedobacter africanus TaxID=151894 RepID=A0ACC6L325_9SPHI|nr:hypothetical protein [Pedobacter africanus]MDR6786058.1 7-keto-8-aminopelargonate synthetase-like enzyme [Pedobacter africanus]
MKIDFAKASFKDFENPVGMNAYERAAYFNEFLDFLQERGHLNYRLEGLTGCGPVVDLDIPGYGGRRSYVSLVSNDYLGFTQHQYHLFACALNGLSPSAALAYGQRTYWLKLHLSCMLRANV